MLSLISSLSMLLSLAFASSELPAPQAGTYNFSNEYEVVAKIHYEVVYAMNDAGRAQLKALQGQGYECRYKMRETWLCKQFQSTEGVADVIRSRVNEEMENTSLVLGEAKGEPGLISKGTDVAEYLVIQDATYRGKTYSDYRLVLTQGNWSIRMGEPTEVQFSLSSEGELSKYVSFPVTDSRTSYTDYSVMAAFRRM